VGRQAVGDIAAAVAVGVALGVPLDVITAGVEALNGVPGQLESVDEGQPFAVIVDEACTPADVERTLKAVRDCGAQHIITVMGCPGDGCVPVLAGCMLIAFARTCVRVLTQHVRRGTHAHRPAATRRCARSWAAPRTSSPTSSLCAPPSLHARPSCAHHARLGASSSDAHRLRCGSTQVSTTNPNHEDECNILSDVVAGFDQEVYRSEEARRPRSCLGARLYKLVSCADTHHSFFPSTRARGRCGASCLALRF
jgi:hypothetical protein